MFDVLHNAAASVADESRVRLLRREGKLLIEQARHALTGPDLQRLEARAVRFAELFDRE
jgi:hypothetical protein